MTEKDFKSYAPLYLHLNSFFYERLPVLIKDTDQLFQQPLLFWLKGTYKELLTIKKDNPERYKRSIDILNRNLPGLRDIVRAAEENSRYDIVVEMMLRELESVPEKITEVQSEDRFKSIEGDSYYTKTIKFWKRKARQLAGNKKSKNAEKGEWVQKIPVRDLLLENLLMNPAWLETWIAESYRDTAEILELFLEKIREPSEDAVENTQGISSFKVEVIEDFEDHLVMAIKRIESEEMLSNHELEMEISAIFEKVTWQAERAGTFEGRSQKITVLTVKEFTDRLRTQFLSIDDAWSKYLESQLADLRIQTEISLYGYQASVVQKVILEETHNYFRDFGYLPIESGVSLTKEIVQKLKKSKSKDLSDKLFNEIRDKLDVEVRDAILTPMQQPEKQKKSMDRIRDQINKLQLQLIHFSEKVVLAEEREIILPKPVVKLDELSWQSLASRFLQEMALRDLAPEKKELVHFIQKMAAEVEETIQIVDVNLMAAIESKVDSNEDESPLEIAVGGLERALGLFEQSIKNVRDKQNEYERLVREKLPGALQNLADTMLSREYDKFELQDKAFQVKERALDWQQKLARISAEWMDKTEIMWRFATQKFNKFYAVVSKFLGLDNASLISTSEKRNLAEYLSRATIDSELPFIYKRLFDNEFEIEERFYVYPDGVFSMTEKALEEWKSNLEANVLIMGEKGSGKSTAVRLMSDKIFNDIEILKVSFDKTIYTEQELLTELCSVLKFKSVDSPGDLINKINSRKSRSIIIVENLHNAYIRNIHGFEALNAFWSIMSATKEKLFWIVTTSRYSWRFFERMSGADQYFSHINSVDSLNKDQLQKAILTRHKSTGYTLEFEPSLAIRNSRSFRKLLGDEEKTQEYLKENYFNRLSNVAEGNLSIGIIFWLQSIRDYDDFSFKIAPLEVADVDRLEIPSRNVLFTLSAFVIHDRLTAEEMAMALHQDVSESRLMLTRLKSKGIIFKNENGYQMNQLVYRQLIRLLKRRNIIH